MKFIEDHFDKLFLGLLFLLLLFFVVRHGDTAITAWGREQASLVLGALVGLITGVRVGVQMEQRKAAVASAAVAKKAAVAVAKATKGKRP